MKSFLRVKYSTEDTNLFYTYIIYSFWSGKSLCFEHNHYIIPDSSGAATFKRKCIQLINHTINLGVGVSKPTGFYNTMFTVQLFQIM